jgi:hypothetical protein
MSNAILREERRGVEGFPSYQVSDLGRVRSRSVRRGRYTLVGEGWTLKTPTADSGGYLVVSLRRDGRQYVRRVHRLVAEAFLGPCPAGMECCHNDGDRANARLDNLRWGTPAENWADRYGHGTDNRGERHGGAKLTAAAVAEIRRRYAAGERPSRIARAHGISPQYVSKIARRAVWAHVT